MKKEIKNVLTLAFAFIIGAGYNNFAMSDVPANYKIAVVDVNKVVAQSKEVQALKNEQKEKIKELQNWLVTVKSDIDKQQTKEGKEKLVKKYDADFAKKQEAIKKNYASKIQTIEKNISNVITAEAKAKKYDLVISKGMVLYGGEDITANVAKLVK